MTLFMCVKFFATLTLVSAFFVTLASSQYSRIIISSSRALGINGQEFKTCSDGKFECRNGKCIQTELLCDGKADCTDQSDETQSECNRPGLTCSNRGFRCDYGACVHANAICNGVKDCLDNSDELLRECPRSTRRTFSPIAFGHYDRERARDQLSKSEKATTCSPLNSISRAATCTRYGERVSCISPLLPYTKAKVTCRINYGLARSLVTGLEQDVECSPNGSWEPEPITCSPVCGVVSTDSHNRPPINRISTQVSTLPWHANLWKEITTSQGPELEFRCSGTIIETNLLLTVAHCVVDKKTGGTEDPKNLRITVGKSENSRWIVQKIKNVYKYCNSTSDIALVELEDPFQFSSSVLPVCLDVSSFSEQDFKPGTKGKIGRSSASTSVPILRTDEVTYASNAECRMPNNPSGDKFCGIYSNERNVCDWNDGSGFVVEKKGLWHLMGVFIKDLGTGVETSQRTCSKSPYALYTNVASYMAWIQDVIFNLVRYKSYPICTIDRVEGRCLLISVCIGGSRNNYHYSAERV